MSVPLMTWTGTENEKVYIVVVDVAGSGTLKETDTEGG